VRQRLLKTPSAVLLVAQALCSPQMTIDKCCLPSAIVPARQKQRQEVGEKGLKAIRVVAA
jgi:hypothetical protein